MTNRMYTFGRPIKCTLEEIDGGIFLLTLIGDDDEHYLDPTLIRCLQKALEHVKSLATKGSHVLITTAQGKHFCHGFDKKYADAAHSNEDYRDQYDKMINHFRKVIAELISLPMPTIAAVNGYACGPGLMLALSHDYLTIKWGEPLLQLHELAMKMTLPDYFTALIRAKVRPDSRGPLALRGLMLNAQDAMDMGIEVVKPLQLSEKPLEIEKPLDAAERRAKELVQKDWDGQVYAETRKSLYPELCKALRLTWTPILPSKY